MNDGGAEIGLDSHPVIFKPPLDGLELRHLSVQRAGGVACSSVHGMPADASAQALLIVHLVRPFASRA
jgi:hypothetical protein